MAQLPSIWHDLLWGSRRTWTESESSKYVRRADTAVADHRRTSTGHTFVHHSNHPGIRPSARSLARPPARSRARCTCMITYTPAHTVTHAHARAATDWQVGDRLQLVDAGSQGIDSLTQNQLPHLDKTALLSGAGYITFNYGSSSAECNRCTVTNGAWCNNPAGVSPEGADDFYSCPYGNTCGTVSNILVPAHVNHACLCACGCVFPLVRIRC